MSNVYGSNYSLRLATLSGSVHSQMTDANNSVAFIHDTYECSAAAQGTVIYLGKFPGKGYLAGGNLYFDALGSNSAIAVGTASEPDAFLASTATTSAGKAVLGPVSSLTEWAAGTDIIATVSGSGAATGTIELAMLIAY
jgi:hypothetical protein